jgi:hypothetical protein
VAGKIDSLGVVAIAAASLALRAELVKLLLVVPAVSEAPPIVVAPPPVVAPPRVLVPPVVALEVVMPPAALVESVEDVVLDVLLLAIVLELLVEVRPALDAPVPFADD